MVAERFSYAYPEARSAVSLHEISLELEPGTFTVLAGVSGSGKSTLLRALCGLVPHFHGGEASGRLLVGGLDVRDHGPGELAAVCGTVFQEPETQVVMGGVRGELELPLEHRGEPAAAVARAVEETALSLGIGHLLERRTDTLSGGELQRVAIAAAMVHGPDLLLLDEPTSQLDPVAGDELVWLLRRLNEDWGTAVVVAEHRLERCLPAADRVISLVEGRIACDAPPREHLAWASDAMPVLATPAARMFSLAGLPERPASVKEARAGLREHGIKLLPQPTPAESNGFLKRLLRRDDRPEAALALRGVWFEIEDGPSVLRGLDLQLRPGERVALMGRNGAGKSTLLRLAKGLVEPTRGRIDRAGEVALLMQNPGDYLIHEHAVEDAGPRGVAAAGLEGREQANPRDLSGGERQRLALEVVLAGDPAVVLLDEPTRGMDRVHKDALVGRVDELAHAGAAVVIATHDTEFAASFADRVVLLGQGLAIADGGARRGARWRPSLLHRGRARDRRRRPAARAGRDSDRTAAGDAVSWQLACLVVLGLGLAAAFGWYERDKPPARVLALVATLAALAVVGRLAFAAFPNVKPTTDIVLFAGYALGAVPGFMVGAIAALVSNIFLSQGPWTPWQMVGWGAVGIAGAVLARFLRGREPGRLLLAAVCGLAGLAFGAWMDLYQLTLAAHQDLDSYLALSATSLPYNLAHAIGNVVFCLLIGPVFIRALRRYRRRLEVRWPAPAGAAAALVIALLLVAPAAASPASKAEHWLAAAQNKDGGFGAAPRPGFEPALQRLGRPRPRGGRSQPARPAPAWRALAGSLRDPRRALGEGHRRGRANGPAAQRRRAVAARLRRQGSARDHPGQAARRRLDRGLRELHDVRGAGAALGRRVARQEDRGLAGRRAERRRRLRGRAGLHERQRHDRRDAPGARGGGSPARRRHPAGRSVAARQPERRRRLRPVQGTAVQHPVDRLRDPGTGRRRRRAGPRSRGRSATCAACSARTAASPTRRPATRPRCG